MHRYRTYAALTAFWLVAVIVAAVFTAGGEEGERDQLYERFELRSETGASFVGAYVDDVFETEERLARRMAEDSWTPEEFAESATFLGFPVAVLLDRRGRAVAFSPAEPGMRGTQMAARLPHLASALEGRRSVSDVISSITDEPVVVFALPLDDERFGVLSGGFNLKDSPLKVFLQRQPISGSRGYILDSRGKVIVSAGPGAGGLSRAQVTSALRGATVNEGRLRAATRIPGTRWTYVIDAPVDAVVAPISGDRRNHWVLLVVLAAASLSGLILVSRATAARARARLEKAQMDHRLRMTVQNAPIGMTMVDLDHKFVEPNDCLCEMLGYSAEELSAMTFEDVTHADDLEMDRILVDLLMIGQIEHYDLEKRYVRSDGTLLWGRLVVSIVRGEDSGPLYFVNQIEDVTEFRAAQAELEHRALYDPLTGLANRGLLMDRLTSILEDDDRQLNTGVSFCDVDHFKQINDAYGHHAGDEVLKEVARRLRNAVRTGDTVARMGGDEFIILLREVTSRTEAEQVIERAVQAVQHPILVGDQTFMVSLSIGLALDEVGQSADALLGDADVALYAAKQAGRGRCVVYDPVLRTAPEVASGRVDASPSLVRSGHTGQRRGRMNELIRHALDHDAVGLAYQPVFDLNSGALVGTEALLRLNDPSGRPVSPRHVIPAAESSGLIVELGRRVLQQAARQAAAWQEEHGILVPVAVNVSAAQLGLEDFPREVLDAVREAGVPARALMLELTESVLLQSGSAGMDQLCALQQDGIELAIDDFGTGFASLSLLHELPAATLKIDQSFVTGIPDDDRATTIVAGVIALAKNFDMRCIAEGIENESQRAYLAERGVLGQGFLLGIPDDAAGIGRLIAATSASEAAHLRSGGDEGDRSELFPGLASRAAALPAPAPGTPLPMDPLTGVYARETGLTELTREMARARREPQPVVVALVTLDDLEAAGQRTGASGTDRLLREVAEALRVGVRPYDLVVRYSRNQFVCAIAGLSFAEWERRLRLVEADINERAPHLSIRVELAEMRTDDNVQTLLARAQSASRAVRVGG